MVIATLRAMVMILYVAIGAYMEEKRIKPARPKKSIEKGDYGYTIEDWERSEPNCVIRVCPCGSKQFLVYSNFGSYETWVECVRCGAKDVVHDG